MNNRKIGSQPQKTSFLKSKVTIDFNASLVSPINNEDWSVSNTE